MRPHSKRISEPGPGIRAFVSTCCMLVSGAVTCDSLATASMFSVYGQPFFWVLCVPYSDKGKKPSVSKVCPETMNWHGSEQACWPYHPWILTNGVDIVPAQPGTDTGMTVPRQPPSLTHFFIYTLNNDFQYDCSGHRHVHPWKPLPLPVTPRLQHSPYTDSGSWITIPMCHKER